MDKKSWWLVTFMYDEKSWTQPRFYPEKSLCLVFMAGVTAEAGGVEPPHFILKVDAEMHPIEASKKVAKKK